MDRRRFVLTSLVGALAVPLGAEAQQRGVYRLGAMALVPTPNLVDAWRQGASELGWVEGRNIFVEYRYSQGRDELFRTFAAEFVRLNVNLIVAVSDPAVRAAKEATTKIPIVMAAGVDPVAAGFVASIARPGGNITGLTIFADELVGKQLELLKELNPRTTRVIAMMPVSPNERGPRTWTALQNAGRELGLNVQRLAVDAPSDVDRALGEFNRERADALLVLPGNAIYLELPRLVDYAAKMRLPAMYSFAQAMEAGGLIAYTTMFPDLFRRIAGYVDKILKGAKPGDLPIEQPTKFELIINLKTAKALGLTIPPSLLARADQIIE